MEYVHGVMVDEIIEFRQMSVQYIMDILKRAGFLNTMKLYYKYPQQNLGSCLKKIENDDVWDKLELEMKAEKQNILEIYVEHGLDAPAVDIGGNEDENDEEQFFADREKNDNSDEEQLSNFEDSDDENEDLFETGEAGVTENVASWIQMRNKEQCPNVEGEHADIFVSQADMFDGCAFDDDKDSDAKNSDELLSLDGSGSDEEGFKEPRYPEFNEEIDMRGNINLRVGSKFKDFKVFRNALKEYSIQIGFDYNYINNDSKRITAKCTRNCGWRIHSSLSTDRNYWQIKSFNNKHRCGKDYLLKKISSKWIARKYIESVRDQPNIDPKALRERVKREHEGEVSIDLCHKAIQIAKEMIRGKEDEQYKILRSYCEAVMEHNPGTTMKISAPEGIFQKLYCCLAGCRNGFLAACRPLICIDGCHLKGTYKGDLLVAVGKDANDNIFPIAYAVVHGETRANWKWFLDFLIEDIGPWQENGWTFMSDRQKGLTEIFDKDMEGVDHRFCVRHLWQNFKAKYGSSKILKDHLWDAARAYTVKKFNFHMGNIKALNNDAYQYLMDISLKTWSRHAMNPMVKCDLLLNNMAESFNSYILEARDKPIITMLETIRRMMMQRFVKKVEGMNLYPNKICPRILKKLEKAREAGLHNIVVPTFNLRYEVTHCFDTTRIVDLNTRTCTCRQWDMNGIPCMHASAAILSSNRSLEDFVHPCYTKSTFLKAYQYPIEPVPGPEEWPPTTYNPIQPPYIKKQSGRPKKQRKRAEGEPKPQNPYKISRRGLVMTCNNCQQKGHNIRSCKMPRRTDTKPSKVKKTKPRQSADSNQPTPSQPSPLNQLNLSQLGSSQSLNMTKQIASQQKRKGKEIATDARPVKIPVRRNVEANSFMASGRQSYINASKAFNSPRQTTKKKVQPPSWRNEEQSIKKVTQQAPWRP